MALLNRLPPKEYAMSTQNPEPGSSTDPSVPAAAQSAPDSARTAPERDILTEDTVQQDTITTTDGVGADPVSSDRGATDRIVADRTVSDTLVQDPAPVEQETRSYQPHAPQRAYSNIDLDDDTAATTTARPSDTGAHPYPAAAYAPVGLGAATPAGPTTDQQQAFPLYVQAPSAPDIRGNRGFGILIGLLATVIFAGLYAAAVSGLQLLFEDDGSFVDNLVQIATSWPFLLAVAGFFLSWAVTATIVNRSGWVHWVLGGFIIGLVVFLAWVGGFLIQERAWTLSVDEILAEVTGVAFTFGPVLAFIVAREIPVWLGGWIAARGRKVRDANLEAQAEYERVLEAGPTTAR